mgnify:FL=1
MRKITISIVMAVSVMAFSFAVADKLAQSSQGWFGPVIFLAINCVGLFCAYKFILWYSKKMRAVRPEREDKEIATLIRNKKGE